MARLTGGESSEPDDPDGLMNDQEMPTADGQMASNTSEEDAPPPADRDESPRWGADTGSGGPGVSGHGDPGHGDPAMPADQPDTA